MEMEKIVSIGDKVDLKQIREHLREDGRLPVYPSRILDLKENNVLQLAMPYHEGRIVPLAVKDKYQICIYAKNGLYTCDCIILERHKTGNMFYLDAAVFTDLKKIQRREFYRYAYRTNIEYRIVDEKFIKGEKKEPSEENNHMTWHSGIMMDLSGGGLRMVAEAASELNNYIELRFPIRSTDGNQMLHVYGKLVRSFPMENNPRLKDHRVEFVNVDTTLQEKIIRFIFEEERRNLSKSRQ